MFHRKGVVQNRTIARRMRSFFRRLDNEQRIDPEDVARLYCRHLWNPGANSMLDEKRHTRARYYVGLSTGSSSESFAKLTKQVTLISDTLLLSHDWTGPYHTLGTHEDFGLLWDDFRSVQEHERGSPIVPIGNKVLEIAYGMHCPNIVDLGRWIIDAEPLLKAGLAWYLPSYSYSKLTVKDTLNGMPFSQPEQVKAIDYLIRDGRAVDASGAEPVKSALVRPVLRVQLPFIDSVSLRDFSQITVEEFESYSSFRDHLRQSFLQMDESINSTQSERDLARLGLEINDGIRSIRSDMEKMRKKRAMAIGGAVIGSVPTTLVAVYGPALAAAVAAIGAVIGATGGVWRIIQAATENSTRSLHQDKWYYVWVLAKNSNTNVV